MVERHAQDSATLNRLVERLPSCRNLNESYKMIGPIMPHLLSGTSGALYVTSASLNILENVCSWGAARPGQSNFAPDDCWALRRGRVQVTEEDFELRCRHLDAGSTSPATCIPLIAHGETLGILCVVSAAREAAAAGQALPGPGPNSDQLSLGVGAAEQISLAIANLQLRDKLRSQSIRDPLTGLFNRRYMEESLVRELHRAKRKKAPLTVLMIDIDHFKQFNDTMGHEAGDALLREFGAFLREHVRVDDSPCRYGGEEFTIILPDANSDGALGRAEALREGARRISVGTELGVPSGVTISIGLATYPDHGDNITELVRLADAALYVAKAAGRDRVMVSDGTRVVVTA
jgi:diguanylate cyclase (GGDEF)-like protein